MKFKPVYLYGALAVIIVVVLLIVAQNNSGIKTTTNISDKQMPMDEVHKNLNNKMNDPNSSNVSQEVFHKLEVMKKDVDTHPNDTLKIREYADFLFSAHKPDEAITYYQKILDKDKKRKDIYFSITFVYYSKQDLVKAEEVTQKMILLFPDEPMAKYNLGAIEATKGNKEKAREIWTKLIKEFPTSETTELAKNSLSKL